LNISDPNCDQTVCALLYQLSPQQACREEAVASISEKLKHKMSVQSPPKLLVEKYLIEIAKNYNIEYEPDPQVCMSLSLFKHFK
jgi:hypothetical protein